MDVNPLKNVLQQKRIMQTWLAEKPGNSLKIINRYVQNRDQSIPEMLFEIA
jgi:putative transcriptional regulator